MKRLLAIIVLLFPTVSEAAPPLVADQIQMKTQSTTTIASGFLGLWNRLGQPNWRASNGSNLVVPFTSPTGFQTGPYSVSYIASGPLTTGANNVTFEAAVDINSDGIPDREYLSNLGKVIVSVNNGDATFAAESILKTEPATARGIFVADVNKDGKQDIVTSFITGGNLVVDFFPGNGNGTFGADVTSNVLVIAGAISESMALLDWNKDGNLDLWNTGFTGNLEIISTGNGDGTFNAASTFSFAAGTGTGPLFATIADINSDGLLDWVIPATGGVVGLYEALATGAATFGTPTLIPNSGSCATSASPPIADLNSDGILDLTCRLTPGQTINVFLGTGGGAFAVPTTLTASGAGNASVGLARDANGDGIPDLLFVSNSTAGAGTPLLDVFIGNGDGTFKAAVNFANPNGAAAIAVSNLATADYNNDGRLDTRTPMGNAAELFVSAQGGLLPFNATQAFTCTAGATLTMVLTANLGVWTMPQAPPGTRCTLIFIQGDALTRTIGTPPANISWLGTTYFGTTHSAPVLTAATANAVDIFDFESVPTYTGAVTNGQGSMWVEMSRQMNATHP